jgi:hypothetical protein
MSTTTELSGVVHDLDEKVYHSHPALSYSTGKHYLRSPAHYLHELNNRKERKEFDFGHAVHGLVLGTGMGIVEIPESVLASNGAVSTTAAKEFIANARADGKVPLKADVFEKVKACANAVLMNTEARGLLEVAGEPEVSLFATDPDTGIEIRGRLDYLPDARPGERTKPIDLKTAVNATPRKIVRAIVDFDYDLQAAMYRHLVHLTRGDDVGPMVHIYVETDEPHGVQVIELADEGWIRGGDLKLQTVLERHAECMESGVWPGYDNGALILAPPIWYLIDLDLEDMVA